MMTIFSPITKLFTKLFEIFHGAVVGLGIEGGASYVLAIAMLTILIRLCLLPFNIKSAKSTRKMQEVQPEVKRLQEKYKNDPQKLNMEMMKLYKEKNVSMTGGCLPSLLPLPILMALYYVFYGMTEIDGQSFLWLTDLGAPDRLFILPVLAAITTYIPTYLTSKATPQQEGAMDMRGMSIGMSLMMGFMSLNFKSILVLYWVLGGVIQIVTTYFLNYRPAMIEKKKIEAEMEEKEAARAPRFVMPEYEEKNKSSKKKKKK